MKDDLERETSVETSPKFQPKFQALSFSCETSLPYMASCLRPKTKNLLGSSVTHAAGHPGGPRTDLWLLLPHRGIHDPHTDMLPFLHERIAMDAIHGMHPFLFAQTID